MQQSNEQPTTSAPSGGTATGNSVSGRYAGMLFYWLALPVFLAVLCAFILVVPAVVGVNSPTPVAQATSSAPPLKPGESIEPFVFRGIKLRMTLGEFRTMRHEPEIGRRRIKPDCTGKNPTGVTICFLNSEDLNFPGRSDSHPFSIGSGKARLQAIFTEAPDGESRLTTIFFRTETDQLEAITSALTTRFGEPVRRNGRAESGLGVGLDIATYSWSHKDEWMELETRCERVYLFCLRAWDGPLNQFHSERIRRMSEAD